MTPSAKAHGPWDRDGWAITIDEIRSSRLVEFVPYAEHPRFGRIQGPTFIGRGNLCTAFDWIARQIDAIDFSFIGEEVPQVVSREEVPHGASVA